MPAPHKNRPATVEVTAVTICATAGIVDGLRPPAIESSRVVEDCFG